MQCQPLAVKQQDQVVASLSFVESLARRVAASMPHSIDLADLVQDAALFVEPHFTSRPRDG